MSYKFNIGGQEKSIIKVIGVGGGGCNAVNHMYNRGIKDVEFIICNTDKQSLQASPIPSKLQIGSALTEGLGAGANPERGREAALESKEEIRDLLSDGTKMVFITAGMGGGTGTGAAPVIAQIARDLDILTVAIVTFPFSFEGRVKRERATAGIAELKKYCDTVLVISNDKLREIYGNLPISEAYAQADNILATAAKSIAELITTHLYINIDFEDVKTVMRNAGTAVMGSAKAEGDDRALKAVEQALTSPLLDNKDIRGAKRILLSVMSGDKNELRMDEFDEITRYVEEKVGDQVEYNIFGTGIDPSLGDSLRVTIVATGFGKEEENASIEPEEQKKIVDLETGKTIGTVSEQDIVEQTKEARTFILSNFDTPASKEQSSKIEPEVHIEEEEEMARPVAEQPVPDKTPEKVVHTLDELPMEEESENDSAYEEELRREQERQAKQARYSREMQERLERYRKLKNLSNIDGTSEDISDKLEIPAYQRLNIPLKDTPPASKKNISRYNLDENNQILGNNKFFHDKPD
ncbi:cell division protein FtsZ [Thermonema rossianum]|uniref:cell division protein FtsZ n=1 Tax=Thermonema rossianum TaxID=55505 RepID=UPI00056FA7DB|nr:cell division protein FtsZ [Thermonema rossianum]